VSKRIGPSMSTEPGWMALLDALLYYFGSTTGSAANDPSMLLSFERPASAGSRGYVAYGVTNRRDTGRRYTPLHDP
jgi:hypothetical protein